MLSTLQPGPGFRHPIPPPFLFCHSRDTSDSPKAIACIGLKHYKIIMLRYRIEVVVREQHGWN